MSKITTVKLIILDYTIDTGFKTFVVDASIGNITVTLPAFTTPDGISYTISRVDTSTNSVTLDGNGALINGMSSIPFFPNDNAKVVSNGGSWSVTNGNLLPVRPFQYSMPGQRFYSMTTLRTISNSATAFTIYDDTNSFGTRTINPVGGRQLSAGDVIRFEIFGTYAGATGGVNRSYTISVKLGGTFLLNTIANLVGAGANPIAETIFTIRGYVIFHAVGASGSALCNYEANIGISQSGTVTGSIQKTPVAVDTTSPLDFDIFYGWNVANAANIANFSIANLYME